MRRYIVLITILLLYRAGLQAQDTIFLLKKAERPYLIVFLPDKNIRTDIAVIVCSGGSYGRTADEEEGVPAARLLASKGVTAFLCDYRVPLGLTSGKDSVPFADAQRALTYIRTHSRAFGVTPSKVGMMGFSAGGHLVSTIGTHWGMDFGHQESTVSLKPDFMILIYPLISMRTGITHEGCRRRLLGDNPEEAKINMYSNELQVKEDTPPTYIVFSIDDPAAKVENGLLFDAALTQNMVKHRLFLYEKGGHGYGVYNSQAKIQWTDLVIPWIIKEEYKKR